MINDRINNLEEIVATQDRQINDLSDMVNAQWKEIDRLKLLIKKADAKIQSLEDGADAPEANAPPPHY